MTEEQALAIPRVPVQSSNVAEVGYSPDLGALVVVYRGRPAAPRTLYAYTHLHGNVSRMASLHAALLEAESKGRFVRSQIVSDESIRFEKFTLQEQKEQS